MKIIHISERDIAGLCQYILWVNGEPIHRVFKTKEELDGYIKNIKEFKIYVGVLGLIIYQYLTGK